MSFLFERHSDLLGGLFQTSLPIGSFHSWPQFAKNSQYFWSKKDCNLFLEPILFVVLVFKTLFFFKIGGYW